MLAQKRGSFHQTKRGNKYWLNMSSNSSAQTRIDISHKDVPFGILAFRWLAQKCNPYNRINWSLFFKITTFMLTYMAYTFYHMSRKPISVVKSVLHTNCSTPTVHDDDCGYAPFDGPEAKKLFGMMDSAFLFSYAVGMFVSGYIAERVSLRYYLSFGMILSGIFVYMFGAAKIWDVHSFTYFMIIQALGGLVQTTGWPGVVTLLGRWFGKSKRGFIFGIWNSHTSIGNILGTLIAAQYVESNWALSFVYPGLIIGIGGILMFLFVIDTPEIVGLHVECISNPPSPIITADVENNQNVNDDDERTPILRNGNSAHRVPHARRAITIASALKIPGVIEFSLCLFFSKLVSYTFLYWLPLYISSSTTFDPETSADLSTSFDVGGIFGAIVAGYVSDRTGMPATVCICMLLFASPVMLIYQSLGPSSIYINVAILVIAGLLVNGPYALITTAVSAELGQHRSLHGSSKALATVTAIIDGTGSIGAAIGPLLAGYISQTGWKSVFYMLIAATFCAMLLLVRLVSKECRNLRRPTRIREE